jgi:hypothetical protein
LRLDDAGAVGVSDPSGAVPDFRAMVGAPMGELVVANFMVGMPAVGVGTRGLVVVPESGIVGAPTPVCGRGIAAAVGVNGMVGVPVGARDLMGTPAGTPPGPAVLMGMVGAGIGAPEVGLVPGAWVGATGGPAMGAVVATLVGRGGLDNGVATGMGVVGGGVGAACAN